MANKPDIVQIKLDNDRNSLPDQPTEVTIKRCILDQRKNDIAMEMIQCSVLSMYDTVD
ncbi:hypothetical protein [Lapidilactobacillus bayanensis]|uniref:hypothetical protein n=1 Tax=Lapidilactobacillus bayanensis TaxID=2485998 RepID=UPI0013DDCAE5|nr:hypothetical protein [Lapidilactobacillus bayanensis]